MKKKVLETLTELGFELEPIEELGYEFDYETTHLMYVPDKKDEDFLVICVPGIYEIEEKYPWVFMELANRLNASLKYIKAYPMKESLWLFYERELMSEEDFLIVIPQIIAHLDIAVPLAHEILTEIKKKYERDELDEDDIMDFE